MKTFTASRRNRAVSERVKTWEHPARICGLAGTAPWAHPDLRNSSAALPPHRL